MLPVRIINPSSKKFIQLWGLVDTGAEDCALPCELAEELGHILELGDFRSVSGVGGETNSWAHTTTIEIFNHKNIIDPSHIIKNTPIDFVDGLQIPLLGVRNFLSNFLLTLDYPNKQFSIRYP